MLFEKLLGKSDEFQYLDPNNSASFSQIRKDGMFIEVNPAVIVENDFWSKWYIMKPEYKNFVKCIKDVYQEEPSLFQKKFAIPICDPFIVSGRGSSTEMLAYALNKPPAVGYNYNRAKLLANNFFSACGSHLGTKQQYLITVGVISFIMYQKGISEENILSVLCSQGIPNAELGIKNIRKVRTGVGMLDLLNTNKILSSNKNYDGFYITSNNVTEFIYSNQTAKPWYSAVPFVVCDELFN